MTTLVAVAALLFSAAPRTDGLYVAPSQVALLESPTVSAEELGLIQYVAFTPKSVTVHYVAESETYEVRRGKDGVEIKKDSEWDPLPWEELADGAVVTGLMYGNEPLRFVKGSMEKRRKAATEAFTRAQLQRLAGKYGEGSEAITIDASGGKRGQQRLALTATQCVPGCSSFLASVCLTTADLVLLETDEGLLRLPNQFELCGSYRAGIETANGVLLRRAKPGPLKGALVSTKQLESALSARGDSLKKCNKNAAPRKVKLEVTVAASGLVSRLLADDQETADCISVALSRLTFPPQAAASTLAVEWTLPSP